MRTVRFAATILRPDAPDAPLPGFRQDGERLLQLAAEWRETALELGEFAPERPALRLVSSSGPDGKHPTEPPAPDGTTPAGPPGHSPPGA
ncbi:MULTISPECIES: hypothetical protein [unclassified Streptomyces]|uniref:hypothetical protein n=1 Tax=unclassified Streptomyces TaxID=2593676 RepID=UPI0011E6C978|nr:hypothetical protein [Streptomyces sp. sk2.1]TXS70483.1 hypothetical protein EAO76_23380 [Streptomyces sp. sk2.1]